MMSALSRDAVTTRALTKRFGGTAAVDQLDLTVPAGEVFGFLGPNGAGKSTTVGMLLGLLRPTSGQAWIFGDAAGDAPAAHRHLAYVPAEVALWPNLTGAETLDLLSAVGPGTDRIYRSELVERFDLDVNRRCGTYSTGNRQKVALIAAFSARVELLIFDEPTSGLDPLMEQQFRGCIRAATERGQSVFLSSHHLAEVEAVCQRVGILNAGRLVEVAGLADLRRLRFSEVDVIFRNSPVGLGRLSDLQEVADVHQRDPLHWTLTLTGSPSAALRVLAEAEIETLEIREPSLEEIFLEYYGPTAR